MIKCPTNCGPHGIHNIPRNPSCAKRKLINQTWRNDWKFYFLQTLNTSLPMIVSSQDSTTKSITKLYSTEHLPSIWTQLTMAMYEMRKRGPEMMMTNEHLSINIYGEDYVLSSKSNHLIKNIFSHSYYAHAHRPQLHKLEYKISVEIAYSNSFLSFQYIHCWKSQ